MLARLKIKRILLYSLLILSVVWIFNFTLLNRYPNPNIIMEVNSVKINPACVCVDQNNGIQYDFCYNFHSDNPMKQKTGRRFNCSFISQLKALNLLNPTNLIDLQTQVIPMPPILVTAADESHWTTLHRLINLVHNKLPGHKLMLYDLGLKNTTVTKIKTYSHVDFRRFPFEKYPSYVRDLVQYRWKAPAIAVGHHSDSAIQLHSIYKFPIQLFDFSYHGNFPVINPGMYEYFPTDIQSLKNESSRMHGAGLMFMVKTRDVMHKIIKWFVLCSLERDCMAPPGHRPSCNFTVDRYAQYAHCHRYDQSAVNLLLTNENEFDPPRYKIPLKPYFDIQR